MRPTNLRTCFSSRYADPRSPFLTGLRWRPANPGHGPDTTRLPDRTHQPLSATPEARALETFTKQLNQPGQQARRKESQGSWSSSEHSQQTEQTKKSFLIISASLKHDPFCDAIRFPFALREKRAKDPLSHKAQLRPDSCPNPRRK